MKERQPRRVVGDSEERTTTRTVAMLHKDTART